MEMIGLHMGEIVGRGDISFLYLADNFNFFEKI
jgi:hypothetical protein